MAAGGYDCNWAEDPSDELKCLICLTIAREPQQHGGDGCGKVFCTSCVTEYEKYNTGCPNCRQSLTLFKDMRSTHSIKALKVKCSNLDNGCEWLGELGSLETHLQSCDYAPLPCPNECKKDDEIVKLLRKDLEGHLENECPRRYKCPHCNESGEQEERTTTHLETCPQVKVQCPNDQCQVSIPRCEVSTHRSECDYETVSCKYAEAGCEESGLREDLKKHEANQCPKRSYECPHCKITGKYEEMMTTHLENSTQAMVTCPNLGCEAPIACCLLRVHRSTCEYTRVRCKYAEVGCEEKPRRKDIKEHEEDYKQHLQVTVETVLESKRRAICPKKIIKFYNFERRKTTDTEYYSPAFYTRSDGYKMCIRVYANGRSRSTGTHVSVYAFLMKGDNDDSLTWPFTGTVTFELLNQLEDKNHHKDTLAFPADHGASKRVKYTYEERSLSGYGRREFISHADLAYKPDINCQYLKDDTLVFRVSAEAPVHNYDKPWLEYICTITLQHK